MNTKAYVPVEIHLPWDRNEGDIFIEEPMKQLLMVRGWGWMYKEYGEKRAEEIQDKILDFTLTAVNYHQKLITNLEDCIERMDRCRNILQTGDRYGNWGILDTTKARETLKKLKS